MDNQNDYDGKIIWMVAMLLDNFGTISYREKQVLSKAFEFYLGGSQAKTVGRVFGHHVEAGNASHKKEGDYIKLGNYNADEMVDRANEHQQKMKDWRYKIRPETKQYLIETRCFDESDIDSFLETAFAKEKYLD